MKFGVVTEVSTFLVITQVSSGLIGASLSEPHIDGTAGRFHILLWYDHYPHAAVGRTKYVGLP